MSTVLGVDEAGRGPVLGSLFVGAVAVDDTDRLPDDLDDSKVLSEQRRQRLAAALESDPAVHIVTREVTAVEIDRNPRSLTELVAQTFATAINTFDSEDVTVITDTGEADTERFTTRLANHLEGDVELLVEVGADGTYPVVSAASVIAKEARERHVDALTERFGEIGSGYPSDPTTRRFLADYVDRHGTVPDCARRSWATCDAILTADEQSDLEAFVSVDRSE